jgi:uncharacterized membrane protein
MRGLLKKILLYFFQGALVIVPIFITVLVLYKIIINVGSVIEYMNLSVNPIVDPFLGVLVVVAGFVLVGLLSGSFIFRPILSLLDELIERAPLIKTIYSSVKDLMSAFVGQKKRFNKPVLVRVNDHPIVEKLGFITNEDLSELGIGEGRIAVYLPMSYAFSGQVLIVDRSMVKTLPVSSADLMKFIISGGVTEID